ncbi:phage holin [Lactobacillus crispatus]|jgi:phage holin, LL-H family|uniref:phage holin n=1 Tax=Lactobacillus crispatus TaxID=47770 RepID=UPI000280B3A1|nr:phage holin [Lactobacillus crispatus]EKB65340.1 LL-H family phage holin [Lactobacillus crispatus FB049-03]MBH9538913.1 phage holin [Lactobacillus crispatus]MBI1701883.1 holin [Lactobacillus crispatus]MCT7760621.1 phage holin [Lactobacillus crispatus]MCT7888585.1 phage holin [Lactobacillus crispatus]
MTINQIMDLVITISSVALVVIVAIYTKHKVEIDRKAMQGNELAKAEQLVAKTVEPLVYQAEKSGGDGDTKFTQVLNTVLGILDLAHLPHPSSQFIGGEIEKSVAAMKRTQNLIDTVEDKPVDQDKKADTNA